MKASWIEGQFEFAFCAVNHPNSASNIPACCGVNPRANNNAPCGA